MATSKSSKQATRWTAGALIFSGRPDPTWTIDQRTARRLEKLWASLPPWPGPVPGGPVLGYRGCFVKSSDSREWFTYGGVATLRAHGSSESRRDKDQRFEKLLLTSAPKGIIPPSFIDDKQLRKA
jgi:hypothetical protein